MGAQKIHRRPVYLRDDLGIRIQLDKSPSEFGGRCVVVGFAEGSHSTPQSDLHVWWLHATMCEVSGEFQVAFHILGVLLHHSTPLEFYRDAEDVLPSQGNGVSPLSHVINCQKSDDDRTHLLSFRIGRDRNQQKALQHPSDDRLRFRQLVP